MKTVRAAAAAVSAAVLMSTCCVPVFASSPEFARTAEEWAALKDNKLEYREIGGLVEEYNPTVQQNQFSYRKFREDYGDTNDEWAEEYRRLANEIRDDIVEPDWGESNYATGMVAATTAEISARQLEQQADNTLEDSEILRLNYEMAKQVLVQTAQNNMITWHSQLLSIQNAEKAKRLAEVSLAAAQASANVGMGTQIQVLNAQQAVKNAEQTVISATAAADSTRRKLQVMLGWKADAEAEIGEIPEVDITRIDRMDPEADLAKALENNYTLRVNKKKLKNARNGTDVATLNSTIADNEARIAVSLRNAYQTAVNQKNAYLYNFANAQVTAQTAAQTAQRFGLGTASAVENESAQIAAEQAQIALKQSEYSLFQAMEAYDWSVNGLAAASAGA